MHIVLYSMFDSKIYPHYIFFFHSASFVYSSSVPRPLLCRFQWAKAGERLGLLYVYVTVSLSNARKLGMGDA